LRAPKLSRWFLIAGVINAFSLLSYYVALQFAPVAIVVPLIQTSPLMTALLSRLTAPDLEPITPRLITAGACIVAGAGIVVALG
jgi:drug/metabolite transporter (DMT)-like permease